MHCAVALDSLRSLKPAKQHELSQFPGLPTSPEFPHPWQKQIVERDTFRGTSQQGQFRAAKSLCRQQHSDCLQKRISEQFRALATTGGP